MITNTSRRPDHRLEAHTYKLLLSASAVDTELRDEVASALAAVGVSYEFLLQALDRLALAAGELNVATDGMEQLRPLRAAVLGALDEASTALARARGGA